MGLNQKDLFVTYFIFIPNRVKSLGGIPTVC